MGFFWDGVVVVYWVVCRDVVFVLNVVMGLLVLRVCWLWGCWGGCFVGVGCCWMEVGVKYWCGWFMLIRCCVGLCCG